MPCMNPKLANEFALRSSIALAKGMNRIDLAQIIRRPLGKLLQRKVGEKALATKFLHHVCKGCRNMQRRCEARIVLGNIDQTQLSSPRKDILKEIVMNCAQMNGVELPGNSKIVQFSCALGHQRSFDAQ